MTDREISRLIELKWWGETIETCRLDGWLDNFGREKDIGVYVFENLIIYTDAQIDSYVNCMIQEIQSDVYQSALEEGEYRRISETELDELWKKYIDNLRIIPIKESMDEGSSGVIMARKYRKRIQEDYDGENNIVIQIDALEQEISKGVTDVLFVDDFSGTGNQLYKFLDRNIMIGGTIKKVRDLPEVYPQINFRIAVLIVHEMSLKYHNDCAIEIKYVEKIDKEVDFLNDNCDSVLYAGVNEETRMTYANCIRSLCMKIIESDESYRSMEKYHLGLPIIFEYGCPNNSLLLLYAKTDNWKPLVELGDKK